MSKISVIIPVYGVEKYIDRCLKSVVNQTLKDIEIIIVNDDTKDNSMTICQKYADLDNRIKIYNKKNEGLGLTRNYGIDKASGEYIAFLDSDDYVDIDFYEKLYNKAKETDVDVCFAEKKRVDNQGNILLSEEIYLKDRIYDSKEILDCMLINHKENKNQKISMSSWRAIYNSKIIKGLNIKFVSERQFISEDFLFTIDFMMKSSTATFVKGTYHYYCYNGTSLTNSYKKDRFEKSLIFIDELIKRLKQYNIFEKYKKSVYTFLAGYARVSIKQEIFASKKSEKEIKLKIQEIINNERVIEAVKNKYTIGIKNKIVDLALKTKNVYVVMCIFKLNNK